MELVVADHACIVQLIDETGSPVSGTRFDPTTAVERLAELYESMVLTREVDEELVNLQRQGQLALFPSCRGQEAAQVGCAAALRDTDWLFPQYRELGVFLQRGIDPAAVGLMWRGARHGAAGFLEHAVAPMSIPIGTQALHAVGAAMASKWLDDGGVAVAFVGDGAMSEGDVHEAMNLAAVRQAPCLFFVQNNQWAISTPVQEQTRTTSLALKAEGYGMPGIRVDGNDVLACLLVVEQAATLAREGGGPTLIEAVTYRMGAHTTSDDPGRYRDDAEVEAWAARDPIDRCRAYLHRLGRLDDSLEERTRDRVSAMRTRLRDLIFEAPDPSPLTLFDHVYVEPSAHLIQQRAMLAEELDR
jgi:2-oxoisovalerate dehydrogenase E1 component alpha subunit